MRKSDLPATVFVVQFFDKLDHTIRFANPAVFMTEEEAAHVYNTIREDPNGIPFYTEVVVGRFSRKILKSGGR